MLRVGLTGGPGAGKSTTAGILAAEGFPVLYADKVAHDLYQPGSAVVLELARAFGDAVLTPSGEVDRSVLGSLVFGNRERLDRLNAIVHPQLLRELSRRLGAMEEAGTLLEGVLERVPNHLHALLGLSQIRAAADRQREADALLERAIEEHPDDGRAHFLMALTSARRGQLERAWTHVREAERLRFPVPEEFVAALRESTR